MTKENTKIDLISAIQKLEEINLKNGGDLLNGNFSFVAKKFKLKVGYLRKAWEVKHPKIAYVRRIYATK
jgi:hypothetical protein